MKLRVALLTVAFATLGLGANSPEQTPSQSAFAAPAASQPANTLSPELSEIAKMSAAGLSEKTILTYVSGLPAFALRAEDVVGLHQRGVSLNVITAMLQRPQVQELDAPPSPPPTLLTATSTRLGPNPPIIYPTRPTEAVPLTSRFIVAYPSYSYPVSSVIIVGSGYIPPAHSHGGFGSYGGFGGYGSYNFAPRSYGWGSRGGYDRAARCRF